MTRQFTNVQEDLNLKEHTANVSFSLTNSHVVLEDTYPRNPNSINVGGLHTRPAERIEDDEIRDSVCKVLINGGAGITNNKLHS